MLSHTEIGSRSFRACLASGSDAGSSCSVRPKRPHRKHGPGRGTSFSTGARAERAHRRGLLCLHTDPGTDQSPQLLRWLRLQGLHDSQWGAVYGVQHQLVWELTQARQRPHRSCLVPVQLRRGQQGCWQRRMDRSDSLADLQAPNDFPAARCWTCQSHSLHWAGAHVTVSAQQHRRCGVPAAAVGCNRDQLALMQVAGCSRLGGHVHRGCVE